MVELDCGVETKGFPTLNHYKVEQHDCLVQVTKHIELWGRSLQPSPSNGALKASGTPGNGCMEIASFEWTLQ